MSAKSKRPGFVLGAAVLLAVIVLYVLSSGPTRMVAVEVRSVPLRWISEEPLVADRVLVGYDRTPVTRIVVTVTTSTWWEVAYDPLVRASRQTWGAPIRWYWSLFPVRKT